MFRRTGHCAQFRDGNEGPGMAQIHPCFLCRIGIDYQKKICFGLHETLIAIPPIESETPPPLEGQMISSSTFSATDGAAYEQQMGRWSRRLAEPFLDFAELGDGGQILDLGCGTGSLTLALAGRLSTSRIVGLDASGAYIDHAQRYISDPRIEFHVGDACAMPFPDASFDHVLSMLVLPFVPNTADALAEIRRVARPGAVVAAASWDARGGVVAQRLFVDTAAMLDPKADALRAKNFTRPTTRPGDLAAAWRHAGFLDIRETMLTIRMEYADFDDYWGPLIGGQGPAAAYVATLDASMIARLREHVRRAYLDADPDGPRSYAATAWAVKGRVPDAQSPNSIAEGLP
jgi:SAM-dependent methyltransferase